MLRREVRADLDGQLDDGRHGVVASEDEEQGQTSAKQERDPGGHVEVRRIVDRSERDWTRNSRRVSESAPLQSSIGADSKLHSHPTMEPEMKEKMAPIVAEMTGMARAIMGCLRMNTAAATRPETRWIEPTNIIVHSVVKRHMSLQIRRR